MTCMSGETEDEWSIVLLIEKFKNEGRNLYIQEESKIEAGYNATTSWTRKQGGGSKLRQEALDFCRDAMRRRRPVVMRLDQRFCFECKNITHLFQVLSACPVAPTCWISRNSMKRINSIHTHTHSHTHTHTHTHIYTHNTHTHTHTSSSPAFRAPP